MAIRRHARRLRGCGHSLRCAMEGLEGRILLFSSSSMFGGAIHDAITAAALSFVTTSTLGEIQAANDGTDSLTAHCFDDEYHYNDSRFADAASVIRTEYQAAVTDANPAQFDSAAVAAHFGAALHTIQDFYAHSNWVAYPSLRSKLFDSSLAAWNPAAPASGMILEGALPSGLHIKPVNTTRATAADYLQVQLSGIPGAPSMGIVTSWCGSASRSRSPAGAQLPHGAMQAWITGDEGPSDPLLAFDHPESDDLARNKLYNAAYNLAVQQTRHEFARLASLVSARYGSAACDTLYRAWTATQFRASTTAGSGGTTLTLTATGAPTAGDKARFYQDTNRNGVLDTSTDQYLGEVAASSGQWQWKARNRGICVGANTWFAVVRYPTGAWSQPWSTSLTVAKGTPGAAWIIDDEGAGFTLKGKWKRWRGKGYAGDEMYPAGASTSTATWTYAGLSPGVYQVAITWGSGATLASNAPYAVYDGSRKLKSFSIDQRQDPRNLKSEGGAWCTLGAFTISSGQLRVTLSNPKANARVYADAVRLSLVKATKSRSALFSTAAIAHEESRLVPLIEPAFDWSMPARYGLDENHNGRIDLRNSRAYANPQGGYTLLLDASRTVSQVTVNNDGYQWTITGPGLAAPLTALGKTAKVTGLRNNAEYSVSLTVHAQTGAEAGITQQVNIRDILIVALGDSYSSGEGNPDIPQQWKLLKVVKAAQWADGVSSTMERENREAHRSTLAASSQTALAIEKSDPHTSVTFVMLSASGATIDNLLSKAKPGCENPKDSRCNVPAQIPELKTIVGSRPINVMTISAGGNDIGFTERIQDLLLGALSVKTLSAAKTLASHLGLSLTSLAFLSPKARDAKVKAAIKQTTDQLIQDLPAHYASLDAKLRQTFTSRGIFNIGQIIVTDYPNPTRDDKGKPAAMLKDIDLVGISASDALWAERNILTPLNLAVQTASTAHGWQLAGPLSPDFLTHGYAAKKTWYVTNLVGHKTNRFGELFASSGTLHPNKLGHKNIADHLLSTIQL